MDVEEISVTNVGIVTPTQLAIYVSQRLLNTYVPVARPNSPLIVTSDTANLIGDFSNRLSFATELWSICRGILTDLKNKKRHVEDKDNKKQIEDQIETLNSKIDILYRVIQALQNKYDATSRQVTILTDRISQ